MIDHMAGWTARCNEWGDSFWRFSMLMLLQVTVLVIALACLEILLRKRTRAITRYCLWTLVLAKLVLPVQLGTPMSLGYWIAPASQATVDNLADRSVSISHPREVSGEFVANDEHLAHSPARLTEALRPIPTPASPHPFSETPVAKQQFVALLGSIHWKAFVLLSWAVIVAILTTIVAFKAFAVRKLVRSATDATDEFAPMIDAAQRSLGMKSRRVGIRVTDQLSNPAICGFWSPTILLPRRFCEHVDRDQLNLVLIHELAHWKRFDLHVNCLQTVLQVLYFYNPLVWFANSMIRRLREEAVDETVLVASRSTPQQYGNTLLDVAAAEPLPAELTLRLVGVVESRRLLASRIKRIVGLPVPKTARLGIAVAAAIFGAGLLLLPMAGRPSLAAPKDSGGVQNSTPPAKSGIAAAPVQPEKTKDAPAGEPNLIGRLVDETGAPVTDAEVELTSRRNYQRRTANTDSAGRYRFTDISAAGEYEIEIQSKRWVGIVDRKDLPRVDLKPNSQVVRDFTLARACQLTVEVVDDHGQPVKNFEVMSSLATDNQIFASRAVTNKKGQATLTGLKPSSEERLVATMGGTMPYARRTLKLDDPSTPGKLKIVLPAGETVTGKALCSDGKPAAGWRINAMPTWWRFGMSPMGQVIAADGSFSLPKVGPDRYNVIVSIPTGQRMSIAKPVLTDIELPAGTKPLAIKIDYPSPDSQGSISGHITYVGGKLERGLHIFANGSENRHGSSFVEPGKQDFEIGPIPRGTYTIQFDSTEIEPLTLPDVVIPSDKKLEVEVKVRGEISLRGTVVYAGGGKPVTKYRAQIAKIRTLKGPNYVQDANWHDIDDATGAFNLRVAGPGIYTVQVAADGMAMAISNQINTETASGPIHIEISKGSPLTGTVVDEQGKLIDGAEVTPLPTAGVVRNQVVGQLVPGESAVKATGGMFTLPQLAPSRGVIRVSHSGFAPTILDANAAENKTPSGSLKVVLHPGATVRGRVYDADGRPQANTRLRFQDQDAYGGFDDEKYGELAGATTDAEGNYEVRNIPARYCYVQRDDPWKSLGTVRHTVFTENGKTHTLDFGGTTKLAGRIIVNGTPLANGRIQLSGENPNFGIYKAFARTDQNGAFTFWGTPPGERTLYFSNSDQSNSWVRVKTIHAEAGNQNLGDLAAETATLSVAVQAEPGASLDGANVQLQEFNSIWPFGNTAGRLRERTNREAPYVFDDVPTGQYELIYYRPNQFAVRQRVDIEPGSREQSVVVKVPAATASLAGKLPPSICDANGCRALNVWSSDGRLTGAIMPTPNGTYQLKNVPAGQYAIKDKDTRNSPALLTVSLRDDEHKTVDITADAVKADSQPYGFVIVDVFTADGVPIPGCEFRFDDSANAPTLSSSQNGHMDFLGKPGGHQVTIAYPGFEPVHMMLDLKPVGKDGRAVGEVEQRVQLQQLRE
jgi:beta-lactamase regulating signal transducer with metallopeptidase domain/protocatechuate 3,4-dioxygenase beta subunit